MRAKSHPLLGLFLSAACVASSQAADNTEPSQSVAVEAGMRAYVDPATGELSGQPVTAEQQRAAEATDPALRQDDEGLRIVYFEDGSSMMDLQGRFQQATVAEVQADGSLGTWCSDADHIELGKHRHDSGSRAAPVAPARDDR